MNRNSKFQRRHYEAIADVFNEEFMDVRQESSGTLEQRQSYEAEVKAVRMRMIKMFTDDNPNFDRERFYAATERGL